MDPSQLHLIPANVFVDIASTTVFAEKLVQLIPPKNAVPQSMHRGQVLDAQHVTVEINTVFEQLSALLMKINPMKLNSVLSALSSALSGRGQQIGEMIAHLDHFFATIQPRLPQLEHEFDVAPVVLDAYADAAPDLIRIAGQHDSHQPDHRRSTGQSGRDTFRCHPLGRARVTMCWGQTDNR